MSAGRKHKPPPTELHYHGGQVIVLYADDERIRSPHRALPSPETNAVETTTEIVALDQNEPPLDDAAPK